MRESAWVASVKRTSRRMPISDLNLLRPLLVLLEELHVSQAAERSGITQPAMSRMLERLRAEFDDELLVRDGRRYERSPRGERLLIQVRDILERIDLAKLDDSFEPQRCDVTFRIATTDYVSAVLAPAVARDLQTLAPKAVLELSAADDRTFGDVAAGRVDIALTSAGEPPATLEQRRLFEDTYVCLVAADHPATARRFDLARYLSCRHVAIDVLGGAQPAIDSVLAASGLRRTVGYRTPFLTSAAFVVAATNLVLTAPRRQAEQLVHGTLLRIVGAPREFESFAYTISWHKRLDASPAHAWFLDRLNAIAAAS